MQGHTYPSWLLCTPDLEAVGAIPWVLQVPHDFVDGWMDRYTDPYIGHQQHLRGPNNRNCTQMHTTKCEVMQNLHNMGNRQQNHEHASKNRNCSKK